MSQTLTQMSRTILRQTWQADTARLYGQQRHERALTFRAFIARVHPRFVVYPHLVPLIAALQQVADEHLLRLLVFMPPRHGKSELVSRLFPAYYLLRHPDRWAALASYGADLAYMLSRSARDFYAIGGGAMRDDAAAVKLWMTEAGGGLWSTGVGGPATGKGATLAIIDDPLKDAEQAQSSLIRAKQHDWWQATWSTRFEPNAAAVLVATRWHADDLPGWLLTKESSDPEHWHIIDMPALQDGQIPDIPATCTRAYDDRPEGMALCPARYDEQALTAIRQRIGEYWFASLYQQRPAPRDGGMFTKAVTLLPVTPHDIGARVRYWDKAGAHPGKGDWTAGVLLALRQSGRIFVEDVARFQLPAGERNQRIRETALLDQRRDGAHVVQWVEQPPGDGVEATRAVIAALSGLPAFADPVRGDKVSRAEPFAAQWQIDQVDLLAAPWNAAYLDELRAFPTGAHDDQVDATSGAYARLISGRNDEVGASPFSGYRG